MAPINVALTGGKQAPGGGKAPAGGERRYLNRANNRMETPKAMRAYRAPANQRVSAASRAMGAPRAHAAAPPAKAAPQPKSTPYVHYLGTTFGFPAAKGRGIEGLINASQNAERGTVLAPYQQKAGEIGNTERTVSNRVGAFNQQAQGAFQGLVGQQEGSAKTFENQAAETALQSQKGIETAGQNAITSSGGYLDPQLRAQIAASQAEITGLGQAGVTRANEQGQAQTAYLRQLQAANLQRGTEGQREIGNIYGAERARNTAAENQALGRLEAKAKAERITIPKELKTAELAENKLRQAGELGVGKLGVAQERNAVTARGQNLTRQGRAETNATSRENKQEGTSAVREGHRLTSARSKEGHELTRVSAQERNRITAGKYSAGKPMSGPALNKASGEIYQALQAFKELNPKGVTNDEIRGALTKGGYEGTIKTETAHAPGKKGKESEKYHTYKTGKVDNGIFIRAAEEIWYNHYLSPEVKAVFRSLGIPEKAWSNELLGAAQPPPPNTYGGVRGSPPVLPPSRGSRGGRRGR